jgi:hypothetical protein
MSAVACPRTTGHGAALRRRATLPVTRGIQACAHTPAEVSGRWVGR